MNFNTVVSLGSLIVAFIVGGGGLGALWGAHIERREGARHTLLQAQRERLYISCKAALDFCGMIERFQDLMVKQRNPSFRDNQAQQTIARFIATAQERFENRAEEYNGIYISLQLEGTAKPILPLFSRYWDVAQDVVRAVSNYSDSQPATHTALDEVVALHNHLKRELVAQMLVCLATIDDGLVPLSLSQRLQRWRHGNNANKHQLH